MATTRAGSGQIQPNLKIQGNEGIVIPVGTTAQRNTNPVEGEIRFNTDLNTFEGYTGQVWGGMGPFPFVKSEYFEGDGSTYTFALEQQVANQEDLTVLLNGVQLRPGIDFQLVGQRNIVFEEDDGTIRPPSIGSTISIRYFVPITSASVIANSISVEELAVVPGSAGQLLAIDQNLDLYFTSILPETSVGTDQLIYTGNAGLDGQALLKNGSGFEFGEVSQVAENSISVRELAVSDGLIGQVLATDGQGNLSFISVSGGSGGASITNFFDLSGQIAQSQIPDNTINVAKLAVTDGTAGQILSTDGFGNLAFVDAAGGGSSDLVNDTSPQLGGNLDAQTFNITGSGTIEFGPQQENKLSFLYQSLGDLPSATTWHGMFAHVHDQNSSYYAHSGAWVKLIDENKSIDLLSDVDTSSAAPNANQALVWSGTQWTPGNVLNSNSSIGDLADVDTTTVAPTDGQALVWNNTNSEWVPGTVSSGSTTQNLFQTIIGDSGSTVADSATDSLTIAGGTDIVTSISGDTVTISFSGTALTSSSSIGDLSDVDITSTAPNNGQVLVWNNSNSTFEPGDSFSAADFDTTLATKSIDSLSDVDTTSTAPTSGQVLKWNGSNWAPANDITSGGSGLDADTFDGFDSTYYLDYVNLSNAPTVNSGTIGRLAYYSSNGSVISETSTDLTWDNATGSLSIGGALEADSIQSTGTGVPTFTSGSDIEFNAASGAGEVRVVGDLDVSGVINATTLAFVTGATINELSTDTTLAGNSNTAVPTESAVKTYVDNAVSGVGGGDPDQNVFTTFNADTGTLTASTTTETLTVTGGTDISTSISGNTLTISYAGSAGATAASDLSDVNTSGATTGDMLYYDGSNWVPASGPVIEFIITSNGASDYVFNGPGFASGGENDPDLVLYRGFTYRFRNTTGGAHPFLIRTSSGGAEFTDGVSGSSTGTVIFEVPMTPSQTSLVYQCQFHAGMLGNITIV